MPDYIEDLTLDELEEIFTAFLDAAQVPPSAEHREQIWQAFLASLLTRAIVVERSA